MGSEMTPEEINALTEHLSYFGYTVEVPSDDQWYAVKHPRGLDFYMRFLSYGVRLHCPCFFTSPSPGRQPAGFLEFVNAANEEALIGNFFSVLGPGPEDCEIRVCALLSAKYDRSHWAALLDFWRHDLDYAQSKLPELRESCRVAPTTEASAAGDAVH